MSNAEFERMVARIAEIELCDVAAESTDADRRAIPIAVRGSRANHRRAS
jgi:hypothetical protein